MSVVKKCAQIMASYSRGPFSAKWVVGAIVCEQFPNY